MINLNLAPDAVLTLSQGDAVSVDGVEMVFEVAANPAQVFITTVKHTVDDYYDLEKPMRGEDPDMNPANASEDEKEARKQYIRHVRSTVTWYAQLSRAELYQCLTSGTYTIS